MSWIQISKNPLYLGTANLQAIESQDTNGIEKPDDSGFFDGYDTTTLKGFTGCVVWVPDADVTKWQPNEQAAFRKFAANAEDIILKMEGQTDPNNIPAEDADVAAFYEEIADYDAKLADAMPADNMGWPEYEALDKIDGGDPKTGLVTYDKLTNTATLVTIPPAGTPHKQVESVLQALKSIADNYHDRVPVNVTTAISNYTIYLGDYAKAQIAFTSDLYKNSLPATTAPLSGVYDTNDYFNDDFSVSIATTNTNKDKETDTNKQGYAVTLKLDPTGWDTDLDERWESGTWTINTDLQGELTSITFTNDYSVETDLAFQSIHATNFPVLDVHITEQYKRNWETHAFSVGLTDNSLNPKTVTSQDVYNKLTYILSLVSSATPAQQALLTVIGNQLKNRQGLKLADTDATYLDREVFAASVTPPAAAAADDAPPATQSEPAPAAVQAQPKGITVGE